MEQEIWKDIPGYEGDYKVSNLGNIKSFKYNKEKLLKSMKEKNGYFRISLCKNNKYKKHLVHRLVALTFIENIENKSDINHKNGVKSDNRVSNIEWCSKKENILHKFKVLGYRSINLGKFGKEHYLSMKVNQYDLQGNFIKSWGGLREIERVLGIKYGNISKVCKGKGRTAGGFKWKFI